MMPAIDSIDVVKSRYRTPRGRIAFCILICFFLRQSVMGMFHALTPGFDPILCVDCGR